MSKNKAPRIYIEFTMEDHSDFDLPPACARHVQVLRLPVGQPLVLFQNGLEFEGVITAISKKNVHVKVNAARIVNRENSRIVNVACVMPANDRMDWLIEKITELGASSIQPLHSTRSVLRFDCARAEKKKAHWRAISIAACEQCGGNQLPVIHDVLSFNDWIEMQSSHLAKNGSNAFILSLSNNANSLATQVLALPADITITLLIGPEGGFTDDEESGAVHRGFVPATLGSRTLRAETAVMAAVTIGTQ
jgi:16S rRNA (uracil1498-N3)-methyltransferase